MNFDLDKHTIFVTLTGSRVYGTFHEGSDYDHRGVAIPPDKYFLGFNTNFEQYEDKKNDTTIFGFNKFLKLATENNPNIIELLYIPEKFWKIRTPYWDRLVEKRDLFLSSKCFYTFTGYAHAQLKRLRTHRHWLMKGELVKPDRKDYGLLDGREVPLDVRNAVNELINRHLNKYPIEDDLRTLPTDVADSIRQNIWLFLESMLSLTKMEIENISWISAGKELGIDTNFMEYLVKEKEYRRAHSEYSSWLNWKETRNVNRQALEQKCGYDSKHASHLVRLLLMCREILTKHEVIVERPDAEFLKFIRDGGWKYEELESWADEQFTEIRAVYESTTLRKSPDREAIEDLGCEIVMEHFNGMWEDDTNVLTPEEEEELHRRIEAIEAGTLVHLDDDVLFKSILTRFFISIGK